jgi:hypothetical protein
MLVAAIDRNQASAGDKFVARVMPSRSSIPVAKSEEHANFRRQFPRLKGVILRNNEDRRHGDRRGQPSESTTASLQMEEPDYIVSLSPSAREYLADRRKSWPPGYH